MPDTATLLANFFTNAADVAADIAADPTLSGESVPFTTAGNKVTALIDGNNYFGAIRNEVDVLKVAGGSGKFFYFANWWLGLLSDPGGSTGAGGSISSWDATMPGMDAFRLDDGSGGPLPEFIDELEDMANNGTDIRALLWVSPLVLSFREAAEASGLYHVNASTLRSAEALRQRAHMARKVCLNTLAHPLAAMHLKMVICGNSTGARAYVSGFDFVSNRVGNQSHSSPVFNWHDIGAKIEGPAVSGVFAFFRQVWNEQLSRDSETFRVGSHEVESHVDGTPVVASRTFSATPAGGMHVQVLRTAPQMNFSLGETQRAPVDCIKRLVTGFRRPAWDSAPDGIFEFRAALHKAVLHAEKYIYVEDQSFYGQEIMEWINARLRAVPELKVIFVHHADPADGPGVMRVTNRAVNGPLISGLGDTPPAINPSLQIAFYEITSPTVVHSKTWLIDDAFAIIGSANFMRRSLYTDGEISVSVIDEDTTANNFVVDYRRQLWGEHCGLLTTAAQTVLTNLDDAIRIWNPSWRWGGGSVVGAPVASLKADFQRKSVPFREGPALDEWPLLDMSLTTIEYDQVDADARLEY